MDLKGIGNSLGAVWLPQTEPRRVDTDRAAQHAPVGPTQTPALREGLAGAPRVPTLPVEPPAGTDPELWAVLTTDERAFFAKVGAMGPLTYGHILNTGGTAAAPVNRGGRLDVKA